jgi:non-specific serine/threonine protein kinase
VPPLALPDLEDKGWESVGHSESVQLFVERAKSVRPGFQITEMNAPAIAQICLRLDGIPLALELAAARIGMLTPEQIAARLDDRFQLLTGGSRTALPRQQTLRSLIDWSYDLLSEEERGLFCQLSVFVGGWTLEASEAICPDLDVLDLLTQLVKKSLVVAEEREDQAETRFRLLETIRQYGNEKLAAAGESTAVHERHAHYYARLAAEHEPHYYGPELALWLRKFEMDAGNVGAAHEWLLESDPLKALQLAIDSLRAPARRPFYPM